MVQDMTSRQRRPGQSDSMEYSLLFSLEKVPRAGVAVLIPLAMAGDWQEEPVCSQMAMGMTPRQTAALEMIDKLPDPPAPAAKPPFRQE